jgi:cytoskeletal protein CcmA (bactofilin family)
MELRRGSEPLEEARFAWEEAMFGSRRGGTVIGNGLKIVGTVTAEGLVEVNGQVEGDLHCTSLIVSPTAQIVGSITAEQVVVDGKVEGPIQGGDVVLKSKAHVVGDIHHQSLTIEKGAYFDGRATQAHGANGRQPATKRTLREGREADAAAE